MYCLILPFLLILYLIFIIPIYISFIFLTLITYYFPNQRNKIIRNFKIIWLKLTLIFFNFYFCKNFFIAYDRRVKNIQRSIIISNHITNYDWLIIMKILDYLEKYDDLYIILKKQLERVFIAGHAMRLFGYIFLERNWEKDKAILDEAIKNFHSNKYHFLIFPEGTFIDQEAYSRCLEYINTGEKKFSYLPKYTLLPRTKGFFELYNLLKDDLDGIIDITLLVEPFKRFPPDYYTVKNIFFSHIGEISIHAIVDFHSKNLQENFLEEQFRKKDKILEDLSSKSFNDEYLVKYIKEVNRSTNRKYKYAVLYVHSYLGFAMVAGFLLICIFGLLVRNYSLYFK